jgi:hypothetical protein
VLLLLGIGCHQGQSKPAAQLLRYLDLLHRGKVAAAYGLLSEEYRGACDLQCFTRRAAAQRGAVESMRSQVRAGAYQVELRAGVQLGAQELRLGGPPDKRGAWLLSGDPLDFYPQDAEAGPLRALRSFLAAVERRRYDVVLRFVPAKLHREVSEADLRARWEGPEQKSLREQVELVRQHLGEPLVVEGAEARLPLGERREVRLVQEGGRWFVVQLQ